MFRLVFFVKKVSSDMGDSLRNKITPNEVQCVSGKG